MTIIASASAMGAAALSSVMAAGTLGLTAGAISATGAALGGGLAAGALGAGLGAGTAALTGGDVGKGALIGGVGGALSGGLASGISGAGGAALAGTGAQTAIGAGAGAVGGAAGAAAGGEDPLKGAAFGGVTGGIGGYMKGVDNVAKSSVDGISAIGKSPAQLQAATQASSLIEGANIPTSANSLVNQMPTAVAPAVAESSSVLPKIITDNPNTSMLAGAGGLYYLMNQQNQGLMANEAPTTASIYDPIPYSQTDIPRTTVPKYYPYAEGGIVPPQPQPAAQPQAQQAPQPMNKFAQIGLQMAQQRLAAQQPQQPQAPQAGIPIQQPQPTQAFADGGLTSGMPGAGMLKGVYGAGIGKSVAPGVGDMAFGDGKHDEFMQQVQSAVAQQLSQNPQVQPVAPVAPVAPIAPVQPVTPIQPVQKAAVGGIMQDNLGSYSHGGIAGLTRGPGDGVSDSIPAEIGTTGKQPARLADGEFVIPSRIVSELGNGSTEAGAKALQGMVDRVQKRRNKTVGKGKVAVDSKARKGLLA